MRERELGFRVPPQPRMHHTCTIIDISIGSSKKGKTVGVVTDVMYVL